jgi:hypothetical protein
MQQFFKEKKLTYRNQICSKAFCRVYNMFVWEVFDKQYTEGKSHAMNVP